MFRSFWMSLFLCFKKVEVSRDKILDMNRNFINFSKVIFGYSWLKTFSGLKGLITLGLIEFSKKIKSILKSSWVRRELVVITRVKK